MVDEQRLVKLRLRGMTPTQIAQEMDLPRLSVIEVMDRLKLTRKSKDRPIKVALDYTVVRSPSAPKRFSWEQGA